MSPKPKDRTRPYSFDETNSDDLMQPTSRVTSLMHNIFNMRVGYHKIGTKKWIDTALREMRRYGFKELEDVIGTKEHPTLPLFLAKRSLPEYKKWLGARTSESPFLDAHSFPHPSTKVRKAVEHLSLKPLENCAFVTIVTSLQLSYWDALTAAKSDGTRLANMVNRRFKGLKFSFIMVPEVDLKTVDEIASGLMGGTEWSYELQQNRLVYKVHFHGVLYVEGYSVEQIQHALEHTNNAKRTKVFFGLNRIRAIPLYKDPQHGNRNDAGGCVGYSLKQHYRPTNIHRHLETMPEWIWIMANMDKDHSLIKTAGMNR